LWVAEPHVLPALERLLAHGYRPTPGLEPQQALRRVGQVALFCEDGRPSVDLHAEPYSRRFFTVDYARVQTHVRSVTLHGRQVLTFDEPLAFTHLVAHFLQHHFEVQHLIDIRCAWDRWSTRPGFIESVVELSRVTCTLPALACTLHLIAVVKDAGARRTPSEELREVEAHLTMWERVRVRSVVGRFVTSTSQVEAPLRSVERKFLALFLVAPQRLLTETMRAVLLEQDDLVSRYGPGRREGLIWRHLWSKLSD
jgi:hypothetical protein